MTQHSYATPNNHATHNIHFTHIIHRYTDKLQNDKRRNNKHQNDKRQKRQTLEVTNLGRDKPQKQSSNELRK